MIKLSFVIYRDTIVYCQADYSFGTTNKVNGLDPMVLMNGVCQALQIPISHKNVICEWNLHRDGYRILSRCLQLSRKYGWFVQKWMYLN
jgi:hypothetical protein